MTSHLVNTHQSEKLSLLCLTIAGLCSVVQVGDGIIEQQQLDRPVNFWERMKTINRFRCGHRFPMKDGQLCELYGKYVASEITIATVQLDSFCKAQMV